MIASEPRLLIVRSTPLVSQMHEVRHFTDFGLTVVAYVEPFSALDLMEAVPKVGAPGDGVGQHRALLIDLRKVSLAGVSAAETRRIVALRKALLAGTAAEPAAFLLRSEDDFAYIRMHNLWSEAMGVRDERLTVITEDVEHALSWLASVTNQPALVDEMLPHLQ